MNKQQQIAALKRALKAAEDSMAVSLQSYNSAARLESELKSALEELGASKGRRRKAKHELTPEQRVQLMAQMTRGAKPSA